MGLDLSIRVQSNHGTDEFGRDTWSVTQLANLRNCYNILEQLSNRLEDGFSNCATYLFCGEIFHEILKGLQEALTELIELSKVKELANYQRSIMEALSYEVSKLEDFIATNNVPDNDTESYEVHAWW